MEMHGGQYDRDMPGKAQYPGEDDLSAPPVPAAPSGSDTLRALLFLRRALGGFSLT